MNLEPFTATSAAPGEPLTAQAWNEVVEGIRALYRFLETNAGTSLRVVVLNAAVDLAVVRVTAVRDDGLAVEGVRPVPPSAEFVFPDLPPGAYSVRASTAGFTPAVENVTIPRAEVVELTMTPSGAFMPMLIGLDLQTALSTLGDLGIQVARILDVAGRDVAPARPDPEYRDAPVLVQHPAPGVAVPPEGSTQLVVAAALSTEATAEVPSLSGLTLAEAQKALESIGLKVGKVKTKRLAQQ